MIAPLSLPPEAVFPAVVIIKATLLLGAALLATSILSRHRAPAAARHLVWTLAVCGLLALPLFSAALPGWRLGFVTLDAPRADAVLAPVPAGTPAPAEIATPVASADLAETALPGWAAAPTPAPTPVAAEPVLARSNDGGMNPVQLISGIYLLVALALLGRIVAGRLSVRGLARKAEQVTDPEWTSLVRDLAWMLDIDRPITLLRSRTATMPMTWGVRRPTVLLPAEADAWPEERRRVVLLHELAHVARHDCLAQTLAAIACAVYWFHPGAWHAARRLRVERELACDDRVLAAGTRAREYAAHLLEVARAFRAPALAGAAAVSMARPSQLEGRLLAVLDSVRDRRRLTPRAAAFSAAAAIALVLTLGAVRPGEAARQQTPGHLPATAATPRAAVSAQPRRSGPGCEMSQGTTFNCQVDARPGERLTLDLPQFVTARIVGRDRQGVSVRTPSGRTLGVRAERVADGVRVVVIHPPRGPDRGGPELVIEVPSRFDVQAAADGGGVEIRDLRGTFTGHTRGGGLALIRAVGTLRMDAGGGGALIQDSRLDGRLEMRGGGVMLGRNDGDLNVVGAGGTVFGTPDAARDWSGRLRSQLDRWNQQERGERGRDAAADAGDETAAERAAEMARDAERDAQDGPVTISRRSGAIEVRYAPDGAQLSTGSGDIRVVRANGDVNAVTGNGNVTVQSVAGAARISATTGNVSVSVAGRGGDVHISSGRGTVTVALPADYSGAVEVETAYTRDHAPTRVVSDFPLALTQTGWDSRDGAPRRYVRGKGTLGSGTHRVHVATVNGDVRIVRLGRGGDAVTTRVDGGEVTCRGEDCTVRLEGRNGRVTMRQSRAGETVTIAGDDDGYAYATGDPQGRIESIWSMARYAPADAAAQGIARLVLADSDARVQRAGVDALRSLRGGTRDQQLRRISREHRSADIRQRAAAALR
ncbi:MAG TPA: M56 family metallopeptidase [Longimicrobium sp.]|nr:M56 family metallopeptidase [Longimicrobium sp.]